MPRLAYWLTATVFALLVAAKFDGATGFSSLVRFGQQHEATRLPALRDIPRAVVPDSAGYDGQFYAQIALDPSLRDPALSNALDAPSYRARRILAPATAYVAGLGQPAWILQAYALLNVACWFLLALLLYREIGPATPHAFARWLACIGSLGVLDSVRQSLVDLPALLFLVLAIRADRPSAKERPAPSHHLAALWSAMGHLTKETNLLATAALALAPKPSRRRLLWLAASVLPLLVWLGHVAWRLPAGGAGFGNFTWPLWGALEQLKTAAGEITAGNLDSRHIFALVAIPGLFLQLGVLLAHPDRSAAWWRVGVAYGALLLVLGPWVWSGYWAACRAVLPLTIAFNLLLPAGRAFWPLYVAGNLTLLHAVWRFL
jgi:hypothetical protein